MDISKSIIILKALADPSRLKILNALFKKEQYVEEMAQRMGLAVSTVSHHLKKLEAAGLVDKRKEQYYVTYHVREDVFDASLKSVVCFHNSEALAQANRIWEYRKKFLPRIFMGTSWNGFRLSTKSGWWCWRNWPSVLSPGSNTVNRKSTP